MKNEKGPSGTAKKEGGQKREFTIEKSLVSKEIRVSMAVIGGRSGNGSKGKK